VRILAVDDVDAEDADTWSQVIPKLETSETQMKVCNIN
jgi:hypothetical protein